MGPGNVWICVDLLLNIIYFQIPDFKTQDLFLLYCMFVLLINTTSIYLRVILSYWYFKKPPHNKIIYILAVLNLFLMCQSWHWACFSPHVCWEVGQTMDILEQLFTYLFSLHKTVIGSASSVFAVEVLSLLSWEQCQDALKRRKLAENGCRPIHK